MDTAQAMTTTQELSPVKPRPSRKLWPFARRLLLAMLDTYGILMTLLLVMWALLGEDTWPTNLLVSLMPGILVPGVFLLLVSLLIRRGRLIALTLPTALVFALFYGVFFIPRAAAVPEDAPTLRVMTFNTHTEDQTLTDMAALIRDADADIVALQELNTNTAEYFARALADLYPYQASHTNGASVSGRGILSRLPLLAEETGPNPEKPLYQRVEIMLDGQRVVLYNAHLWPPDWGISYSNEGRNLTARALLERATEDVAPVLLVGDFNTTDRTHDYRLIAAHYTDTHREVGMGLGQSFPDYGRAAFPLNMGQPIIRIDYVFHSEHWAGVDSAAWSSSAGSDHRPVVATLALTGLR